MPTLSLCMIVKNEEKYLAQCLASAKNCVNEILIVDTGSTDHTLEIAADFGARIFHHPWENDFSKHRNQSLGYAQGDWILWLDADEALEPGAASVIKEAIRNANSDSLLMTMICYFENRTRTSWNNTVKCFKNGQGIHFEGPVHNQVVGFKNLGFCPVKIYHYGYDQDHKSVQKKFERTSRLLQKAIEEDPKNFRHYHDLAVSFSSRHRFAQAVDTGLKAIEHYQKNRGNDPNILWTYFVVASACFNLGQIDKARALAEQALSLNPDHLDSHFVLASVYALQKNRPRFEEAYRIFSRLVDEYRAHPERLAGLVMNKLDEQWRLDLEYGALLLSDHLKTEATQLFQHALRQTPDPSGAYHLAARLCRKAGDLELSRTFLNKAREAGLSPTTTRFEEALMERAGGDEKKARSILLTLVHDKPQKVNPESAVALGIEALKLSKFIQAESLLLAALAQGYETPALYTHLALAVKYQGKIDAALAHNKLALELDENDLNALVNLGHLHYEQQQWPEAQTCYRKALTINPRQTDILLRLSLIALLNQDLAECIRFCSLLLIALDRECDREIGSFQDLAGIYRLIADIFQSRNQITLAREAATFSTHLSGT